MTDYMNRVAEIKQKQQELFAELVTIQTDCCHLQKESEYKRHIGGGRDSFWIDANCPNCGKIWTIYSDLNRDEYRSFDGKKV